MKVIVNNNNTLYYSIKLIVAYWILYVVSSIIRKTGRLDNLE